MYLEWAKLRNWYKRQPLWLIKNYFGVKIGLYFAWLGFYTKMLIFPSIMGIICFIFGAATVHSSLNQARYPSHTLQLRLITEFFSNSRFFPRYLPRFFFEVEFFPDFFPNLEFSGFFSEFEIRDFSPDFFFRNLKIFTEFFSNFEFFPNNFLFF